MKISKELQQKMEHLANLEETDYPFITLYLNTNATHFLEQMEKNRIFLKNSFNEWEYRLKEENCKDSLQSFKNDMQKIYDYMENSLETKTHGLAIFACDKLGIWETFESVMPFENYFHANSFPHLGQLAYQADEYENALLVLLDSRHSRIYQIKVGGFLTQEQEIKTDVHRFHKQGGWAQMRYQRGIEFEKENHYRETAEAVAAIVDSEAFNNIIVFGQDFEIKNFMPHLPKHCQSKVLSTGGLNPEDNLNDQLEQAMEKLHNKELIDEYRTVNDIINKTHGDKSCTTGINDTIDLAKSGRVRRLALIKDKTYQGYRCGDCLYSAKGDLSECPSCKGTLKETDLAEEAIRLTIKNRGEVEIVHNDTPAGDELDKFGGIGAYLRY